MRHENSAETRRAVLVTGPSGAGRSTAIAALEDFGHEAIDNMPLSLVPHLLETPLPGAPLALGLDVRNRDFSPAALIGLLEGGRGQGVELLYLDCRPDVLERRYSETRRRHPLAPSESPVLGIARELALLQPVLAHADLVIDTSELTPHELREELSHVYGQSRAAGLSVSIESFSYKRGLPGGLDMVFDCRFLRNPHWVPALRPFDGRAPEVRDHIATDPRHAPFVAHLLGLLRFVLPAHVEEGKSHLAIGLGCTGGQHRSVALAENLGNALAQDGWQVSIRHRELERRAGSALPERSGGTA